MSSRKGKFEMPEIFNEIRDTLFDGECPLASFYIWIVLFMILYFIAWMPDQTIEINQTGGTPKYIKTSGSLRAWLVVANIIGGLVGYYMVHRGCQTAGKAWSIVWFVAALVMLSIITIVILSGRERVSLVTGGDVLKILEQTNGVSGATSVPNQSK